MSYKDEAARIVALGGRKGRDEIRKCEDLEVVEEVIKQETDGKGRIIILNGAKARKGALEKAAPEPKAEKTAEKKKSPAKSKAKAAPKKKAPAAKKTTRKRSPKGEKTCAKCGKHAKGEKQIEKHFGYRNVKSKTKDGEKIYKVAQSYCRDCRKAGNKKDSAAA